MFYEIDTFLKINERLKGEYPLREMEKIPECCLRFSSHNDDLSL